MTDHEALQADIPGYVRSTLDGERLRRLESHLAGCAICPELVAAWREIALALAEPDDGLFSPHPEPLSLRAYAFGQLPHGAEVAGHLSACDTCQLEVEIWRDLEATSDDARGPRGLRSVPHRRSTFTRPAMALASGLLLGAALVVLVVRAIPSVRGPSGAPPGMPPAATVGLAGPLPLWILPGPLRGGVEPTTFDLPAGFDQILLAVRPALAAEIPDEARLRFEIRDQHGAVIWSSEAAASRVRLSLASSEVVPFAVGVDLLKPGAYEFLIRPAATGPIEPIERVPFKVAAPRRIP